MILALLLSAVMQLIIIFVPFLRSIFELTMLDGVHWIYAVALALVPVVVVEIWKLARRVTNSNK
jgi:Ca2+-transporting ATPase